ncbi:unnamed protein product [Schistosoma margrebowiei]|uniref:mannose-1-phosphate guanylyltransferase n=1 Tax=Schistosoma margrebowiei TaxID=48269 RepID=A0A183MMR6_9TREM|nr:unnamed protein product [Schistosoma margrebowiei]
MKALILIGGYGTRLRPLTLSIPKPLVEFANKPMLLHQIKALLEVDITEIILAINREAEVIQNTSVKIVFSYEKEALDTGGPLAQAAPFLAGERFFVLNSDIICNYPFKRMLEFHISHGKEGTMAVTKVEEPSKYGAVVHNDQTGLVKRFVEKPSEYVANRINAGLYIFEPTILKRIEVILFANLLFTGFWMDIGQPADYLTGMRLYLGHLYECKSPLLTVDPNLIGNVLVHETAKIGHGCRIGPNVTIGAGVIIEDGVRISNSAIFSKSIIKSHSWLNNCIVGWRSVVGKWVRMENVTVLGEDVTVKDELFLNGALVLPHNSISQSVSEPHIIM